MLLSNFNCCLSVFYRDSETEDMKNKFALLRIAIEYDFCIEFSQYDTLQMKHPLMNILCWDLLKPRNYKNFELFQLVQSIPSRSKINVIL